MAFLFFPMLFDTPFSVALNHLLKAESWARERLAPFAGETIELRAPPFPPLRLAIQEDGLVKPALPEAEPSLTITLRADSAVALLQGEEHFMRSVQIAGNAKLADAVMLLVRHLRWDAEEDLSRLVGDVAAHRLVQAGRSLAAWQADASHRLAESFAEYLTEESRLLVRRAELDALSDAVAQLRDGIERLQKRIERLG